MNSLYHLIAYESLSYPATAFPASPGVLCQKHFRSLYLWHVVVNELVLVIVRQRAQRWCLRCRLEDYGYGCN